MFGNANGEVEVIADANGQYEYTTPELDEAVEGQVEVTAPGYADQVIELVLEPGSTEELNIQLQPQP
ncbi:MAG: hypothetical protein RL266_534 [Bacteroidota bacterium]